MELNKKDERNRILLIRKKLKEDALRLSPSQRISCTDLQLLEQIVFEFVPVTLDYSLNIPKEYRGKTVYFKYIALDGNTLRKLDLSKISFDDVVLFGELPGSLVFLKELDGYETFDFSRYVRTDLPMHQDLLYLNGINAKIDLTKSAFAKYLGTPVCVGYVDFEGTDLSNNQLRNFAIYKSVFIDTNIGFEYPKAMSNTKEEKSKGLISVDRG